jgi:hypothetical protein
MEQKQSFTNFARLELPPAEETGVVSARAEAFVAAMCRNDRGRVEIWKWKVWREGNPNTEGRDPKEI